MPFSLEKAEGHQGVEEIASTAILESKPFFRSSTAGSPGEHSEDFQLDGGEGGPWRTRRKCSRMRSGVRSIPASKRKPGPAAMLLSVSWCLSFRSDPLESPQR